MTPGKIAMPIEKFILILREQRVMLDYDLAMLYGVPTKALNQAVKRNEKRFPAGYMFKLTPSEKTEVVTNCDHLQILKFSPVLPYAFTEHGAVMLASVLNSPQAIRMSLYVVDAFVRIREYLAAHKDLSARLDKLEKKHDRKFKVVFDAIRRLIDHHAAQPKPKRLPPVPRVKGFMAKRNEGSGA